MRGRAILTHRQPRRGALHLARSLDRVGHER